MLSLFGRGHAQCNKGNLGQKGFPHSPCREGQTHYVTEVLNSLFFNFDALSFILCSVGSLRIVFYAGGPEARVDCPLWLGRSMQWAVCVTLHPCLRSPDTKCQLRDFPLPEI